MKLFREKPGVISEGPLWGFIDKEYLYLHPKLLGLFWIVITEWEHDKHLAM